VYVVDIFLFNARGDRDRVRELAQALESDGYPIS
jgi:hypothetical protein